MFCPKTTADEDKQIQHFISNQNAGKRVLVSNLFSFILDLIKNKLTNCCQNPLLLGCFYKFTTHYHYFLKLWLCQLHWYNHQVESKGFFKFSLRIFGNFNLLILYSTPMIMRGGTKNVIRAILYNLSKKKKKKDRGQGQWQKKLMMWKAQ